MATQVRFLKEMKLKEGVVIIGLPGISLVGKIVVDYLIKELNPIKMAEITSDSFPPSVHTKQGVLELIKDEMYYYSVKDQDIVFVAGPVQPSLEMGVGNMSEHYEFARVLVQAFKRLGVKEVFTLAGINVGEQRMSHEPKVVVAATHSKYLDEFKKLGGKVDQPEGLISGAAGLVLGLAAQEGLGGVCLMGETNARLVYGDPGAAKKVLEMISRRFAFKVKMDRIEQEATNIEKAFQQLSESIEKAEHSEKDGAHSDLSYVR
ncbi:MAG: PAC2 family protein [Candidatus Diapherotrites archaeon]|nr:PAC2 family protein [Candidatus Diapherotrites archaeon]